MIDLDELKRATRYSDDPDATTDYEVDDSVDALIAYKNALEDAIGALPTTPSYPDELVARVGKILHTFGCVPDCSHDPQGWEPNARIVIDEIAGATIPDDVLVHAARVLRVISDPAMGSDGADPWVVGSTFEGEIPRALTDRVVDLLCREGLVERFHRQALAPNTGRLRATAPEPLDEVHVVCPDDDAPAAFLASQDADQFAATYNQQLPVHRTTIADRETAAEMIRQRRED